MERETMSWDDLGTGSRELAEALLADDWIPDSSSGSPVGGPRIAGALAYALGVKTTATISVEFYEKSRSTLESVDVWRRTDR